MVKEAAKIVFSDKVEKSLKDKLKKAATSRKKIQKPADGKHKNVVADDDDAIIASIAALQREKGYEGRITGKNKAFGDF